MAEPAPSELTNSAFKPSFNSELNIESLISAPLIAASKANVTMVTGQTRFLLEYCFTKNKTTGTYEPIMITMALTKGVIDPDKKPDQPGYITTQKLSFAIPLMCLIPLNSLVVDKVTIDFDMEITSTSSYETNNGIIEKKAILNGKITNSDAANDPNKGQYKSQSNSKLRVNVNAGPLPLPLGVLAVLDLYTKSLQPVSDPENQPVK